MADLDTIQSTSEQRHAERIAASDAGYNQAHVEPNNPNNPSNPERFANTSNPYNPDYGTPIDQPGNRTAADPDLEPLGVHSIHKRLKEAKPVATTVQGHLVADADKAIEHLLSLIRYVMNSDGEVPRCTEATRTYLRQHLDF